MTITYKVFRGQNVDFLESLINELMTFQAEHASVHPEIMASMNSQNRLKAEFQGSDHECMLVAYDGEEAIGFAYGNTSQVTHENFTSVPSIMAELRGKKFYPDDYELPKTIATFKLLYVKASYRGFSIGQQLTSQLMAWLKSQDVESYLLCIIEINNWS